MNISPINYKQTNLIPGPFIISQGSSGDGMSNTIDTLPILPHDYVLEDASDYDSRRTIERRRDSTEKYDYDDESGGNIYNIEYQEYLRGRYGYGESLQTLHEQAHINDIMHDISSTPSAVEVCASNSPIHYNNNKVVYRPRSNSDTEGGLHSPIGHHSLTSPPIVHCAVGGVQSSKLSSTLQCDREGDDIPAKHRVGIDIPIDNDNCNSDMICEDISYVNNNRTRSKLSYKEQQSTNQWMKECNEHEVTQYKENIDNIKMLIRRRLTFAATVTTTNTEGMRRDNTHTADNGIPRSRQEDDAQGCRSSIQTSSPVGTSTSTSNSAESSSILSQPKPKDPKLNEEEEDEEVVGKIVEEDPLQSIELATKHRTWYQRNGRLVVFKSLPYLSAQGEVVTKPITSSLVDRLPRSIEEAETGSEVITLSPGCQVFAESVYIIDSKTLHQIYPPLTSKESSALTEESKEEETNPSTDTSTSLQLTILKISQPITGYILSSIHSYPLILPGTSSSYINTNKWLWRVTCQPDGAYIREGLELNSKHTGTLPYGTICKVQQKIVNDMGLNRLQVGAWLGKKEDEKSSSLEEDEKKPSSSTSFTDTMSYYFGYVSEFLNPLSGQRGNVIEPIPFPTPALYKVISSKGCVIRRGVELDTSQIGLATKGSILSIVGRSYSDNPRHNCIERLKLTGGGGWISVKLNRDPPDDEVLVEMIGPDESFDPDEPARYHFDQTRKVMEELNTSSSDNSNGMGGGNTSARRRYSRRRSTYTDLSEIADDENDNDKSELPDTSFSNTINDLGVPTLFRSGVVGVGRTTNTMDAIRESSSDNHHARNDHPNRCLICLCDERTATIVHGETGHIAACLTCARILKARGDGCPVCRLPIDLVIQQFWA